MQAVYLGQSAPLAGWYTTSTIDSSVNCAAAAATAADPIYEVNNKENVANFDRSSLGVQNIRIHNIILGNTDLISWKNGQKKESLSKSMILSGSWILFIMNQNPYRL